LSGSLIFIPSVLPEIMMQKKAKALKSLPGAEDMAWFQE
jgi:hypothetical protein